LKDIFSLASIYGQELKFRIDKSINFKTLFSDFYSL
jgi:hypothetical protein